MFYTYAHVRADTNEIFYIGKGTKRRVYDCVDRNDAWKDIVAKTAHMVQILAHWNSESDAFEHERFLISCFRDLGAPLVNILAGGSGWSGYERSEDTKLFMSVSATARWANIDARKVLGVSVKLAMSKPEVRDRMLANRHAAHDKQKAGIRASRCTPFVCVETGQVFEACQDACDWLLSLGKPRAGVTNIHAALNGGQHSAYGYTWKYVN